MVFKVDSIFGAQMETAQVTATWAKSKMPTCQVLTRQAGHCTVRAWLTGGK